MKNPNRNAPFFRVFKKKDILLTLQNAKNKEKFLLYKNKTLTLHRKKRKSDSVAQLVEQLTLNQWVEGSSPSGVTKQAEMFQKAFRFFLLLKNLFSSGLALKGCFRIKIKANRTCFIKSNYSDDTLKAAHSCI